MLTTSNIMEYNYNYTPSWIKSERYLYCDHFAQDFAGTGHASFLSAIKKLLRH